MLKIFHRRFSKAYVLAGAAFVLALATFAGFALQNERAARTQHERTDASWSLIARAITDKDHVIGRVGAPIQLVVYADLSCPYCKSFFKKTLPSLQEQFGDSIVVAYRHLPLASHSRARAEAIAAECVYEQK